MSRRVPSLSTVELHAHLAQVIDLPPKLAKLTLRLDAGRPPELDCTFTPVRQGVELAAGIHPQLVMRRYRLVEIEEPGLSTARSLKRP